MKNYIKWNLNFTTSKLLSYAIFIAATVVALVLKDKQVFVEGMMYATILQGVKAVTEIKNKPNVE